MRDRCGIFGAAAAIRESRGIGLEDIARSTKISLNYLRAIERGEFETLPGGIYNLSYIRQYARAVDLDEQQLLRAYGQTPVEERSGGTEAALHCRRLALGALVKRVGDFLSGAPAR